MPTLSDLNNSRALERLLLGHPAARSRAEHNRYGILENGYPSPDPSTMLASVDRSAPPDPSPFSVSQPNIGSSFMMGTLANEWNPDGCQTYRIYRASEVTQLEGQAGSGFSGENPFRAYGASGVTRQGNQAESRLSGENRLKKARGY